jgi:hypothetical protein
LLHGDRSVDEPTVGSDELEGPIVVEAEVVDPAVRTVEDAQPNLLSFDVQMGRPAAIDEDLGTELADGAEEVRPHVERSVVAEALVLDDQWDVIDAVVIWQVDPVLVVDQEHPGNPAIDVVRCSAVGVRVVPERRRRLVDRPSR